MFVEVGTCATSVITTQVRQLLQLRIVFPNTLQELLLSVSNSLHSGGDEENLINNLHLFPQGSISIIYLTLALIIVRVIFSYVPLLTIPIQSSLHEVFNWE